MKLKRKLILPLGSTALLAFVIGIFEEAITDSVKSVLAADEKPAAEVVAGKANEGKTAESKSGGELAVEESEKASSGTIDSGSSAVKRVMSKNYQGCLTDEVALRDTQRARAELEKMKRALEQKEAEILVREKAVQEELKKIDDAQKELKTAQGVLQAKDEEKITKLVETFETMAPKAAAGIVGNLEKKLAVQAMSRLTPQKLGKILSAMPAAKSADLTEALAGVVRAEVVAQPSIGGTVTADAVKGGDKNANQQQQQQSTNSVSAKSETPIVEGRREPASGSEPVRGRTPAK